MATNWTLADIWNEAAQKEDKPLKKRNYVYASEIGGAFYDRFLKMAGVPYTNPPTQRSRRKFLAGNIWEHTVKQLLIASGVYKHDEIKVDAVPYYDCLAVHGRLDFIAGGYIDADIAFKHLADLNLPDFLFDVGKKIIEALEGQDLEKKIIELKSVSTFAMDKVDKMNAPIRQHTLQGTHYEKNAHIPADILYICKDDCRMAQFSIKMEESEPLYREDLLQMTEFIRKNKKPPLEPLVKFDDMLGKFIRNLGVEYSPYLSHYSFNTPDDYHAAVKFIEPWNRVLNRMVMAELGKTTPSGKPITLTPANKEIIADIKKAGHDVEDIVELKIKLGVDDEEEAA